jgi:hypothetical protein
MSGTWNLARLIDQTRWLVNQASNMTDQGFAGATTDPDKQYRDAINEAYVDEIEEARQHADPRWFVAEEQFAWPSGQTDIVLPVRLRQTSIERLADVTNGYPGQVLWISDWPQTGQYHWRDRNTLYWSPTGPPGDRTIAATYHVAAEWLKDDTDEPTLIANQYRHLLVWAAGCIMITAADMEAPRDWRRRVDELRERYYKFLSMGRPSFTGFVGIRNTDPEFSNPHP